MLPVPDGFQITTLETIETTFCFDDIKLKHPGGTVLWAR
jgi:hypothetical protein